MTEWNPHRQWPEISNQLYEESAQKAFFLGKLALGVMVLGALSYGINYFAYSRGFPNIGEYFRTIYVSFITASFALGFFGILAAGKALKFAESFMAHADNAQKKSIRIMERKTRQGALMCGSALVIVVLLLVF